ncbi:ABC transporter substrate-binding protein [Haloferax sp. Atlit-4N]|uniref:ABC transporter substrate-binding protein n=1 Tax=unclassified Haloferax TaxID=2625095 RepID=UPI000E221A36|nr:MULTISPECIES: ABC transporter substrate-binding protein [unclassified Haloferax]RDZ39502.1 ABC transporter substrate-binding protein [Haloferax sp. Atlit-19N]RDZ50222.1 ABC transporter substrate-binding protein [Haloferax sp. Atlit-4N]
MVEDSQHTAESNTNRRTILKSLTAVGVGTASLSGCLGNSGGSSGGDTESGGSDDSGNSDSDSNSGDDSGSTTGSELEVLHGWTGGDGAKAIEDLTSGFKEEYPSVPTDFRPIGGSANTSLNTVVSKRLSNRNPPSSFAGWPGENLTKYDGVLGDVTDSVWKEAGFEDTQVEEATELCKYNGKYVAVPIGSHRMNCLFYNVSVLEEAGVDPESLTGMDALFEAMDKVAENTDAAPMAHAMKAPYSTLQLWAAVMLGQEGFQPYMDFIGGNGDEAALERAFETTKQILTDYITDDASSIGFTTANQKVMDGEAAFIHQGNWVVGMYNGADLTYNEDWGFEPFPGTDGMYGLHLDAFIYTADNPSPENSAKWLQHVGSREAQVGFNELKGSIPTRNDVDPSQFSEYFAETIKDFQNAEHKPPTLAHGLAVGPNKLSDLKGVITSQFTGPYNSQQAAQQFLDTV